MDAAKTLEENLIGLNAYIPKIKRKEKVKKNPCQEFRKEITKKTPKQDLEFNNKREHINLMENIVDGKAKNWLLQNKS